MEHDNKSFSETVDNIINQKFAMCTGCSTFIGDNNNLSPPFCGCNMPPMFSKELLCPCLECLIKMVCTKDCDKVIEYAKYVPALYKNVIEFIIDDELERRYNKDNE